MSDIKKGTDYAVGLGSEFRKDLSDFKSLIGAIDPYFIDEVGKVLAHGAKKYGRENWRLIEIERKFLYVDALHRHINAYQKGETKDAETGLHHLAHAVCNIMFLFAIDNDNENK